MVPPKNLWSISRLSGQKVRNPYPEERFLMKRLCIAALLVACLSQFANGETGNRLYRTECKDGVCQRVYVGSEWENQVVDLVNSERGMRGLRPLKVSLSLMKSARSWSGRQAAEGRMYHSGWPGMGENVIYNYKSPEAQMKAWMNSAGHRANILNPKYTEIGVGVVMSSRNEPYGTQQFK
jgi:uncharacterized protein YkwD